MNGLGQFAVIARNVLLLQGEVIGREQHHAVGPRLQGKGGQLHRFLHDHAGTAHVDGHASGYLCNRMPGYLPLLLQVHAEKFSDAA
jgi:hypothetical protein